MARAHRPDVAVLDLQMPGTDGLRVAATLRESVPDCRTMIVTSHSRPGHLKRALAAGVRGFVPKTASAQQLAEIIRSVHGGSRYVDPELAADAISAGDSPLSAREAELLELAADGAPIARIAEQASLTQGNRPQLSVGRRREAGRREPARGGPDGPRTRLDLSPAGHGPAPHPVRLYWAPHHGGPTGRRGVCGRSSVGRAQPCQG